ncbi:multicopper oxidase family protein [Shimia sp. SDUM112013]|uniref:multicopper oxidase family protein n=1 Tax=Shimia sp. SDUM112013 TaxID=3136160 RepID=UPI0032EBCFD1
MPHLTRRQFSGVLLGGVVASALPRLSRAASAPRLVAQEGMARLAPPDYPETVIWGYGGTVPGPEIRVRQGQRVMRDFMNQLPQPSTVHWHGIRIDNAMDGVAGMTQPAVASGENFLYDFAVPDAGTYWYHPHNRTWEQMARGLYGALIVEEPEGAIPVDHDEVLLLDDWRLAEDAQIAGGFGALHDWAHGGRLGNWVTVNGDGAFSRPVKTNARMRLRLVNTANARIFTLEAQGFKGWVVALDGMPLDAPEPLERLTLAPAQRADLVVDVLADEGEEALLVSFERDGGFAVAGFPVTGRARPARLAAPGPLPPNPVPELGDLTIARSVPLVMEGGAMGGLQSAMLNGQDTPIREMAAKGKVWAFNGMADMSDTPLIAAERGETIRIRMTNDTAWPHGMHLHGHHFREVMPDGTTGPLRDTLLMDRGAVAEIAFVADNPGKWLLHCHMLEHSAAGMMTWLSVT